MKKIICMALFMSTFFCGCSTNNNSTQKNTINDYPVTVQNVTINTKPENVVVLSDSLADVVLQLEYENQLVGKSASCTQEKIASLPDVDDGENLDVDKINQLNAKVVIYDETLSVEKESKLKQTSLTSVKLEKAKNRSELQTLYSELASIFNGSLTGSQHGQKVAKGLLITIDDIIRVIPQSTVPLTACYLINESGLVITDDTFASNLIESVGVINVAKDVYEQKIEIDELILANPNWIFCDVGVKDKILNSDSFQSLDAVKNNQVFEISYDVMTRQGANIIQAITEVAGVIYPELLQDSPTSEIRSSLDFSSAEQLQETVQSSPTEIQFGDTGEEVLKIQNRLDDLNYLHKLPNSIFDKSMLQAIKDFQFLNKISVDGKANQLFLEKLFSNDAIIRPDPAREK